MKVGHCYQLINGPPWQLFAGSKVLKTNLKHNRAFLVLGGPSVIKRLNSKSEKGWDYYVYDILIDGGTCKIILTKKEHHRKFRYFQKVTENE
jgi:hypothetical protein